MVEPCVQWGAHAQHHAHEQVTWLHVLAHNLAAWASRDKRHVVERVQRLAFGRLLTKSAQGCVHQGTRSLGHGRASWQVDWKF